MTDRLLEVPVFESTADPWDVCFSYASEDGDAAAMLREALLERNVKVFDYSRFESKVVLLATNLFDELAKIYTRAPFCVLFVSRHYKEKFWTQYEYEYANTKRALKNRKRLIVVYLDDARLEDLESGLQFKQIGRDKAKFEELAKLIDHNVIAYKAQRRRQRIFAAVAVLLAILAVIGLLQYLIPPSNTRFTMTGADPAHIYVRVWNTGSKSSELLDYRLKFGRFPVGGGENATVNEAELRLSDGHRDQGVNVIENGRPTMISLFVDELSGLPKPGTPERYSVDEILEQLNDDPVTLEIRVKESNDRAPRVFHTRSASIPAKKLAAFIEGRMR